MQYWAGVSFTALGGQTGDFLQRAANQNFKLRCIRPQLGGFSAQCSAKRYFRLAKLAKICHVKLHITTRTGAYFRFRGLFARKGIWCGAIACLLLFFSQQNLIWQIEDSSLTIGQRARITAILWEYCGIVPGAYSSEELLAYSETVLLTQSDEFSWVSLNFTGGRLSIEVTAAALVPEISVGNDVDLRASVAGQVVSVNLQQGTAMVKVGDEVEQGQVLIAAARLEHDEETLVYEPTAGEVLAQFSVCDTEYVAFIQQVDLPSDPLAIDSEYAVYCAGHLFTMPKWSSTLLQEDDLASSSVQETTRMTQLTWFGLSFPITIFETNQVYYEQANILYSTQEALALARLACSERLYAEYPDAIITSYAETFTETQDLICYEIEYQIIADIAE
ncbi:MAG: sporulation protein YqfD [Faecalibacterium sp.]